MVNSILIDIYELRNLYNKRFPIDIKQKKENYKCTRCKREISSTLDKNYVLRDFVNIKDVCAQCYYELYLANIKDKIEQINKNINQDPMNEELEQFNMIHQMFAGKEKYNFEDIKDKYEFGKEPHFALGLDIIGINTGNNIAIVYGNRLIDTKFMYNNRSNNPYVYYNFYKEIFEKFINIECFEDHLYKLISCKVLSDIEQTDEYGSYIKDITQNIQSNFDSDFEFDKFMGKFLCYYNDEEEELASNMTQDFINNLSGIGYELKSLYDIKLKESIVSKWIDTLEKIEKGYYEFNGKLYNIDDIIYSYENNSATNENGVELCNEDILISVYDQFQTIIDSYFLPQISIIYFEAWRIKNNKMYLLKCLKGINEILYRIYSTQNSNSNIILSQPSKEAIFEILESIVDNISIFYNKNKLALIEITEIDAISIEMINNINVYLDEKLEYDKNYNLTPNAVLHHLINVYPLLYIIDDILVKLNEEYIKLAKGSKIYFQESERCRKLKNKFNESYEGILDWVWSGINYMKNFFGDDEIARVKCDYKKQQENFAYIIDEIIVILNGLLDSKYNDEEIKERFDDIFRRRKSNFNLCDTSIELENNFEKKLDEFLSLLSKFVINNNSDLFNVVSENLKKELEQKNKSKYVSSSVFNTLATAEYLYKLFDVDKELENLNKGNKTTNKDYSCISIMYYTALEDLLNEKIYVPYKRSYLGRFDNIDLDNTNEIKQLQIFKYLPGYLKKYYYKEEDSNVWKLKDKFMLGNFAKLLSVYQSKNGTQLLQPGIKWYLKNELKIRSSLLDKAPHQRNIITFGESLSNILDKRNAAAHGGNVSIEAVSADKENTYKINEINKVKQYKGLIIEFLSFLP
ncbi:hypothetical protein [Clostridium folliculivorans]|uniref:hypothetical protein n=1 Tax=Clostridium folliculivorans TaxID=2886038 RepID=UPI0021C4491D|nr:hypothetical protein [Clostridium folliculivorans]GKU29289.1 hypothetical protein CFB3_13950 [Clostridium folliculivorans]